MYSLSIALIIVLVLLECLFFYLNYLQSKFNAKATQEKTLTCERPRETEEQPLLPSSRSSFQSTFLRRPSPFDPNIVGKKKVESIMEEKDEDINVWTCKYCKEKNEMNSKHCYFCSFKKSSKRFHPAIRRSIGKIQSSEANSSDPIEESSQVQPASTDNSTIDQHLNETISIEYKPELQIIKSSKQFCRGLLKRGTLLSKKVKKRFHKRIRTNNQEKILHLRNKLMSFDYEEAETEEDEDEEDEDEDEEDEDAQNDTNFKEHEENQQQGGSEDDEDGSIEGLYLEEVSDDE